ncbi:glycosyltransferase family 4 protein [Georgenia yuyongxinii]|uniref:Glycosyltransferase family 4 protein n=1 Tax=Georgenia yuyongxinii TaxID=2589797 RepID=A0A5B8C3P3_9MICO|nr:glycosyltransferase family 4 protein [Georgenia yuyongxinii]QDC23905.1 glycosyltransferase family 4 protein [Georgenia yuyongxinii]
MTWSRASAGRTGAREDRPGAPSRVLIVEPDVTGHRLLYVRLLAEAAQAAGHEVHLALAPGARRSVEFGLQLAGVDAPIHESARWSHDEVAALSRRLLTDRVLVPDGDRFAQRLALRPRWAGSGDLALLIMRPFPHPGLAARARGALKGALLRRAGRMRRAHLAVLSSPFSPPPGWRGVAVAIDPVLLEGTPGDVAAVRRRVGLRADCYWFAVLGVIDARKNLDLVLDALLTARPPATGVCLAGSIDAAARAALDSRRGALTAAGIELVVVEARLSNAEFDALVRAVDCVVVAHSNEGASGVLAKAATAGTRIAAAGARSLRRDCTALAVSSEWSELRVDALAGTLARARDAARPHPVPPADLASFTRPLLGDLAGAELPAG